MTDHAIPVRIAAPPRFEKASPLRYVVFVLVGAILWASFQGSQFSLVALVQGAPQMWRLVSEMLPPDFSRLEPVGWGLLQTLQMALVGTVVGVLLSLPIAVLATRTHSPHPLVGVTMRTLISISRTVPDLIWALIFVVAVGLGPFAGTLAIVVDTIGFCGRFFAEAMEEADKGPQEALLAIGASRADVIGAVVLPATIPSMVGTSLFSLEKATRASVVLGIVGAGGIGMELQVSLDLFNYPQAATILLAILMLVVAVEYLSGHIRKCIIDGGTR